MTSNDNFSKDLNFEEFGPQLQAEAASAGKKGYVEGAVS
jgi:hypothetical protein